MWFIQLHFLIRKVRRLLKQDCNPVAQALNLLLKDHKTKSWLATLVSSLRIFVLFITINQWINQALI